MNQNSRTVTSKDGTKIAYDQLGKGPAVILVDGALAYRAQWGLSPLAPLLADDFTVFSYDRRGRGESSDAVQEKHVPFAVEREIEDIEAILQAAGGPECLFGISSGASLALEAAIQLGGKIKKLAMYEAPYNSDETARQAWRGYTRQLGELLAANRRGDAVALFMMLTGASAEDVDGARQSPDWRLMEAVAPTLAYDHTAILGEDAAVPVEKAARLAVPTLVLDGGMSYPFMHATASALAKAIPHAQHRTLEGQTHEVAPEAIAPVLAAFFKTDPALRSQ